LFFLLFLLFLLLFFFLLFFFLFFFLFLLFFFLFLFFFVLLVVLLLVVIFVLFLSPFYFLSSIMVVFYVRFRFVHVEYESRLRRYSPACLFLSFSFLSLLLLFPNHLIVAQDSEPLGCPTRPIILQEAVSNAILTEVIHQLGVTREQFKSNHPGGAIGAAKW
jgi:hypothetical protein